MNFQAYFIKLFLFFLIFNRVIFSLLRFEPFFIFFLFLIGSIFLSPDLSCFSFFLIKNGIFFDERVFNLRLYFDFPKFSFSCPLVLCWRVCLFLGLSFLFSCLPFRTRSPSFLRRLLRFPLHTLPF